MPRNYPATKSICIVWNGINFRRYPNAKQWSHRVYYTPHAGHRKAGVKALHQEIWMSVNGPIPAGKEIHHTDGNPDNNSIENLECLTKQEHDERHSDSRSAKSVISEKARAAASEWHKSEAGREWHREHAKKIAKGIQLVDVECDFCGVTYQTKAPHRAKFCSTRCRQRRYAADKLACAKVN